MPWVSGSTSGGLDISTVNQLIDDKIDPLDPDSLLFSIDPDLFDPATSYPAADAGQYIRFSKGGEVQINGILVNVNRGDYLRCDFDGAPANTPNNWSLEFGSGEITRVVGPLTVANDVDQPTEHAVRFAINQTVGFPYYTPDNEHTTVRVIRNGRVYTFDARSESSELTIDPFYLNSSDYDDLESGLNNWKLRSDFGLYHHDVDIMPWFWRAMNPISGNPLEKYSMKVFTGLGAGYAEWVTNDVPNLSDFETTPSAGAVAWTQV